MEKATPLCVPPLFHWTPTIQEITVQMMRMLEVKDRHRRDGYQPLQQERRSTPTDVTQGSLKKLNQEADSMLNQTGVEDTPQTQFFTFLAIISSNSACSILIL